MAPTTPELPVVAFASKAKFAAWLRNEHAKAPGVWLKIAKKGTGVATVTYAEAVEVALCYGWIDGQRGALDETYFVQRFTPRKTASPWSKINVAKAEALIASGEMKPAGLAEIERAKADGRWDRAYSGAKTATVPADLQAALDANPNARAFFATISSTNRYAIIYRVGDAKKPETRARRIEKFVAMLEAGDVIHA